MYLKFADIPIYLLAIGAIMLLILDIFYTVSTKSVSTISNSTKLSCPNCYQCSLNPITSTKTDLILVYYSEASVTIRDLFVSIRNVGIKATVYLVLLENSIIKSDLQEIIQLCDINKYYFKLNSNDSIPQIVKYSAFKQFLVQHSSIFNRILYVESNEVYFQGDPFTDSISSNGLHLILEGNQIYETAEIANGINNCFGKQIYDSIKQNQIMSNSLIGGSIEAFIEFIDLIIAQFDTLKNINNNFYMLNNSDYEYNVDNKNKNSIQKCFQNIEVDKLLMNKILWNDEFNISIVRHGCSSQFVSADSCCEHNEKYKIINKFLVFIGKKDNEAAIFFRYARFGLSSYFHKICHISTFVRN